MALGGLILLGFIFQGREQSTKRDEYGELEKAENNGGNT